MVGAKVVGVGDAVVGSGVEDGGGVGVGGGAGGILGLGQRATLEILLRRGASGTVAAELVASALSRRTRTKH